MSVALLGAKSCMVFSTALFAAAVEQTQQAVNQWIPVFLAGFAAVSALMAYLQGKANAKTAKADKMEFALIAENNKKEHTSQIQELRITVDGKLSKLVDLSKEVSKAEGKAEGKAEERAQTAKSTADKAEGKAAALALVAVVPTTQPPAATAVPGDEATRVMQMVQTALDEIDRLKKELRRKRRSSPSEM